MLRTPRQGKPEQAEDLYNKCLEIELKVYGPDSTQAASSYNNLALLYEDQVRARPPGGAPPQRGVAQIL